tara:strand:+ start:16549 stop:17208 length:660 start_codon:yes stop_codon:yes gene_type:complete
MNIGVSCICVTQDRYDLLFKSIEQFLDQTYKNKELIIVDDSISSIPNRVKQLIQNHNICILYIRLNTKKTIGYKRNKAISLSKYSYIAIWDDDDIHYKNRLTTQMKYFNTNQHCDMVVSNASSTMYYISALKKYIRIPRDIHNQWWYQGYTCPSMIFKKKLWNVNKYKHINKHEDYYFIKSLESNNNICITKQTIFAYHIHPNNITKMGEFIRNNVVSM